MREYNSQLKIMYPLMLGVSGLFRCTQSTDDSCAKIRVTGANKNSLESQEESKNCYDLNQACLYLTSRK